MTVGLLILHGLLACALLGVVSHQVFSRSHAAISTTFIGRYRAARASIFPMAVAVLFVLTFVGGGFLYPHYVLDVRAPLEELGMRRAIGLFESKEHLVGISLGCLPLYLWLWRGESKVSGQRELTLFIALVVWWAFLVGHILNNYRGLT